MSQVLDTRTEPVACDGILRTLRLRLAEVEGWAEGAIRDVAQAALREEMARVGRERIEREWRWVQVAWHR
jgi:hypothetical protein